MSKVSDKFQHWFHILSNIHPLTWILLYVAMLPIFATIYWLLPADQFRYPSDAATDWGAWLYYSIVTLTTLGFGEYTPAHGASQCVTAIEVMCGLIFLGFFLNAVGSLKSELDITSEVEKQKRAHEKMERDKLLASIPSVIHTLNIFLAYCYAVTTPRDKRTGDTARYNPDFSFNDMTDLFKPSGLPFDRTDLPAVARLIKSASHTSLTLDSFQSHVDLTLWPEVLEDCFGFVANFQMFSNTDVVFSNPSHIVMAEPGQDETTVEEKIASLIASWKGNVVEFPEKSDLRPIGELFYFIKENASFAEKIEIALTSIAQQPSNS